MQAERVNRCCCSFAAPIIVNRSPLTANRYTMTDHSENTKRIAKNTMMLYGRMLFSMVVSLYTTRVVLNVLGADDYGINNLVGGVVGMMSVVTSLLSQGTSRFITIALGKNNFRELKNTFSACMTIHLALAILILVIGEAFGPWLVSRLNIAPDRMGAAQFVFQLSLFSFVIGITQTPFHAAIVAHERMSVYAYISIWDVVAKLLVAYLLLIVNADKLKLFSSFYFIVGLITASFYFFYCRKHFEECRKLTFKADWGLYKDIFNYTGWNTIGSIAFTLNGQGITIILSAFGTAVNAARGIAGSISGAVYNFAGNFLAASRPQIVKLCAIGDYVGMNNLIVRTSKFSSYLMGIIGIPLFVEMDYVLQLWLKEVPEYTVTFARLTLIQGLIQAIDFPVGAGIHAVGKMKLPNITSAFIYMAILPVSYFAIEMGASPETVYIVMICVYPLALLMDLFILNKYTQFPVLNFLQGAVVRSVFFILLTALSVGYLTQNLIEQGFMRLCITTFTSCVIFMSLIYALGMTNGERRFIKDIVLRKLHIKRTYRM